MGVEIILHHVVRERLDDHPGAARIESCFYVRRGTDWIAHVMQTVEEGDQVVGSRIVFRRCALEMGSLRNPGLARSLAGADD